MVADELPDVGAEEVGGGGKAGGGNTPGLTTIVELVNVMLEVDVVFTDDTLVEVMLVLNVVEVLNNDAEVVKVRNEEDEVKGGTMPIELVGEAWKDVGDICTDVFKEEDVKVWNKGDDDAVVEIVAFEDNETEGEVALIEVEGISDTPEDNGLVAKVALFVEKISVGDEMVNFWVGLPTFVCESDVIGGAV